MLVDTGSACTAVSERDAIKLEIDYKRLTLDKSLVGVGGCCNRYTTKKATVSLFDSNKKWHKEHLGSLSVLKHEEITEECPKCKNKWCPRLAEKRKNALSLPSLLGIDVLNRFKIRLTKKKVFLER